MRRICRVREKKFNTDTECKLAIASAIIGTPVNLDGLEYLERYWKAWLYDAIEYFSGENNHRDLYNCDETVSEEYEALFSIASEG